MWLQLVAGARPCCSVFPERVPAAHVVEMLDLRAVHDATDNAGVMSNTSSPLGAWAPLVMPCQQQNKQCRLRRCSCCLRTLAWTRRCSNASSTRNTRACRSTKATGAPSRARFSFVYIPGKRRLLTSPALQLCGWEPRASRAAAACCSARWVTKYAGCCSLQDAYHWCAAHAGPGNCEAIPEAAGANLCPCSRSVHVARSSRTATTTARASNAQVGSVVVNPHPTTTPANTTKLCFPSACCTCSACLASGDKHSHHPANEWLTG